jgi:hypothetical protein
LALAKPLKQGQKFSSQNLEPGLSLIEKSSAANVKIGKGKTPSTSEGEGDVGRALAHVWDLFGSNLSAFDGEAAALEPCWKHPWKSLPLKVVPKPSDALATKGTFTQSFTFHLS